MVPVAPPMLSSPEVLFLLVGLSTPLYPLFFCVGNLLGSLGFLGSPLFETFYSPFPIWITPYRFFHRVLALTASP